MARPPQGAPPAGRLSLFPNFPPFSHRIFSYENLLTKRADCLRISSRPNKNLLHPFSALPFFSGWGRRKKQPGTVRPVSTPAGRFSFYTYAPFWQGSRRGNFLKGRFCYDSDSGEKYSGIQEAFDSGSRIRHGGSGHGMYHSLHYRQPGQRDQGGHLHAHAAGLWRRAHPDGRPFPGLRRPGRQSMFHRQLRLCPQPAQGHVLQDPGLLL